MLMACYMGINFELYKNLLITGGVGFIGINATEEFL